jgi:hypothetical protein
MTGEKKMFSSYEKNQDPQRAITFGDGNQGLVKGLGKIAISPDHSISNVFLVDSLDYNLLFVSQLCKMGYSCLFTDVGVTVFRRSGDSIAFKGVLEGQLYLVNFDRAELDTCLIAKTNMGRNTPGVYIPLDNEYGFKHVISVDKRTLNFNHLRLSQF